MTVITPTRLDPPGPPNNGNFSPGDIYRAPVRSRFDGTNWVNQDGHTVTAITPATVCTVDTSLGEIFTLAPTSDATIALGAAGVIPGQRIYLSITTGTTKAFSLTPGANFKSQGALSTASVAAKNLSLEFFSDGTNYVEINRISTGM